MSCQFCGGLLATLDSLPSYTYCVRCKRRPDPLPETDLPLDPKKWAERLEKDADA